MLVHLFLWEVLLVLAELPLPMDSLSFPCSEILGPSTLLLISLLLLKSLLDQQTRHSLRADQASNPTISPVTLLILLLLTVSPLLQSTLLASSSEQTSLGLRTLPLTLLMLNSPPKLMPSSSLTRPSETSQPFSKPSQASSAVTLLVSNAPTMDLALILLLKPFL